MDSPGLSLEGALGSRASQVSSFSPFVALWVGQEAGKQKLAIQGWGVPVSELRQAPLSSGQKMATWPVESTRLWKTQQRDLGKQGQGEG